jgi:succinoglycan biosynthesis transport protein ExoP
MNSTTNALHASTARREFESVLGGLEYYSLKDYKRLLLRRKWAILSITLAIALLTSVGAYFYPDFFKASTIVMVDPGKVPEYYVRSTATIAANQRLALLQEQILSNTKLSQIIDEFNLYGNLKNTKTQEQIVAQMRKDIVIEPVTFANQSRELQAFTISFISKNAGLASLVSNRLASLFIEENMKAREQQVMGTAEFFDRELEKAKEDTDEKGRKMEQLKSRYFAQLPESQNAHVQALSNLQLELRSELDAMSRSQQQKVYLQSLLADSPVVVDLDTGGKSNQASGAQEQGARLQTELDQLRTRYGPDYPDVVKKKAELQKLEQQLKETDGSANSTPAQPSIVKHRNPVIESQIAELDQEMQKHASREKELQSQIEYHQSKLESAPAITQQLAAATRDYENAEENYKRMQDHKFSADISSDVETRQKGERFVILEPAQPPARPYEPNRPLIDALGLVGGFLISLGSVLAWEVLDTTIKTERELTERLRAPVFAEIPWLPTQAGSRRQRLRLVVTAGGNTVLALAYLALVVVALR